jgi:hypothetical protein
MLSSINSLKLSTVAVWKLHRENLGLPSPFPPSLLAVVLQMKGKLKDGKGS